MNYISADIGKSKAEWVDCEVLSNRGEQHVISFFDGEEIVFKTLHAECLSEEPAAKLQRESDRYDELLNGIESSGKKTGSFDVKATLRKFRGY